MVKPTYTTVGLTHFYDKVNKWYQKFYIDRMLDSNPRGDDYEYAWLVSQVGDSAG